MKNLSQKESEVLAAVELCANLSMDEIKQRTGLQEHAIRYHLHNLEEREIIVRRPFLNIVPAGYEYFGIYFSASLSNQETRTAFQNDLINEDKITWIAELGGEYSIGMALCVENLPEVQSVLERLSKKYPNIFYNKVIAGQFRATAFGRRYLTTQKHPSVNLEMAAGTEHVELDDLDKRILASMLKLKYKSNRQLGQLMGMALSTLDDRIKRLERLGIICGYTYEVDAALYGMQSAILLVSCKGISPAIRENIYQFAQSNSAITFIYECLGSWDFELNLECENLQGIGALADKLTNHLGSNLNNVKVLARYSELKNSFVPFAVGKVK